MTHILVVDTEHHARTALLRQLKSQGLRATGIDNITGLVAALAIYKPDAVLLDVSAESKMTIFDHCRQLRTWNSIPVILVSAFEDRDTKVQALNIGADDYLVKPFSMAELRARIHAIERRLVRGVAHSTEYGIDKLYINLALQQVKLDGQQLHLTRNEYRLLRALVMAQGNTVTYENLFIAVENKRSDYSSIRGLIRRLRVKLSDDGQNPRYIVTESGVGYRLNMH